MNLTDEFSEKMVNQFAGSEVNGLPYEDFVHEDYMYVLADLYDRGIEEAECWVWCDECDKEVTAMVDTETLYWTCPECSDQFDHNGEPADDDDYYGFV